MRTNKISAILLLLATVSVLSSCRVEEKIDPNVEIPNLGGYTYAQTELDKWLDQNFLNPYNIEVIYRWDAVQFYSGVTKKLVPAEVSKIRPMLSTISKIWFEPYIKITEDSYYGFLQEFAPKTVVLAGSPEYAADGSSMTLGTAEGAVKIFLTNVNAFNSANRAVLMDYMHVIEHEFVHVLNQKINFKPAFKEITRAWYDPTGWTKYSLDDHEAYQRGFFSNYSMVSADEDFAEVMSLVLVYGFDWVENTVIPIAEQSEVDINAAANLRKKIDMVADYLQEHFGIAFRDEVQKDGTVKKGFVTLVQDAIDYVIENPIE